MLSRTWCAPAGSNEVRHAKVCSTQCTQSSAAHSATRKLKACLPHVTTPAAACKHRQIYSDHGGQRKIALSNTAAQTCFNSCCLGAMTAFCSNMHKMACMPVTIESTSTAYCAMWLGVDTRAPSSQARGDKQKIEHQHPARPSRTHTKQAWTSACHDQQHDAHDDDSSSRQHAQDKPMRRYTTCCIQHARCARMLDYYLNERQPARPYTLQSNAAADTRAASYTLCGVNPQTACCSPTMPDDTCRSAPVLYMCCNKKAVLQLSRQPGCAQCVYSRHPQHHPPSLAANGGAELAHRTAGCELATVG
jgi:hypothetical protein